MNDSIKKLDELKDTIDATKDDKEQKDCENKREEVIKEVTKLYKDTDWGNLPPNGHYNDEWEFLEQLAGKNGDCVEEVSGVPVEFVKADMERSSESSENSESNENVLPSIEKDEDVNDQYIQSWLNRTENASSNSENSNNPSSISEENNASSDQENNSSNVSSDQDNNPDNNDDGNDSDNNDDGNGSNSGGGNSSENSSSSVEGNSPSSGEEYVPSGDEGSDNSSRFSLIYEILFRFCAYILPAISDVIEIIINIFM